MIGNPFLRICSMVFVHLTFIYSKTIKNMNLVVILTKPTKQLDKKGFYNHFLKFYFRFKTAVIFKNSLYGQTHRLWRWHYIKYYIYIIKTHQIAKSHHFNPKVNSSPTSMECCVGVSIETVLQVVKFLNFTP